ncbi:Transglutaminase-like enzyme [Alkalibacterium sp. AK22]|uniref:transglutaminase-like domain-containing protein n=1 Tax=Alkalibacterium sp. AK22 TaxID=1229520 RepID=UPI00044F2529|nr:transglutaminase-like domain-containing protein [Alkalibacterium sp. AK22]EXJ23817.1 Transglutaminase-like enzyme [Alkalibacterium sp. AK22]
MFLTNKLDSFRDVLIGIVHYLVFIPVATFAFELNRLTGTASLASFFITTQLIAVVVKKGWLFFSLQAGQLMLFLYVLFPQTANSAESRFWLTKTVEALYGQFSGLLAGELTVTPQLLIMTLLFVTVSLLTYLTLFAKLAIPSFLVGFIYLMIVHTFSANRVLPEMIQLIGFGFMLIALMQLNTRTSWLAFSKSFAYTALFTFGLTQLSIWGIDRLRPTQEWIESRSQTLQKELDNRGVFDWINAYSSGMGFKRTGMGLDDSRLGGPLTQDFTPLFRAYTENPYYWKVLHRTEYTGLGWESDSEELPRQVASPYNVAHDFTATAEQRDQLMEEESISFITVEWLEEANYIAYPYGWYDLDIETSDLPYTLERFESSMFYALESEAEPLTTYSVSYDNTFPTRFDEELLREDDDWRERYFEAFSQSQPEDDQPFTGSREFVTHYFMDELQLPDTLPQRVIDLAVELTEDLEYEYEKVRAIETFLKEDGGYRYSLLEVENTPDGGDYVDHFLFESQIGYCNNFSSAMAVMLRAIGIPTRWTKGFTPGAIYTDESETPFYQVSNSNAHSWVEVFFPSHGWVPFEPSPSFSNPMTDLDPVLAGTDEPLSFDDGDLIDLEEQTRDSQEAEELAGLEEDGDFSDTENPGLTGEVTRADTETDRRWTGRGHLTIAAFLISIVVVTVFRWSLAMNLIKWLIIRRWIRLDQACRLILRLLRFKSKRHPSETVSQYLTHWKPFLLNKTDAIDAFAQLTDTAFYSSGQPSRRWTPEQTAVITDILDLLPDLPDLKRQQPVSHPLSGKLIH